MNNFVTGYLCGIVAYPAFAWLGRKLATPVIRALLEDDDDI